MTDILMYHGTPRWFAAELEQQLRFVSALFDVVPLDDAGGVSRTGRRRLALTFDDGLRSNVAVAYPILRKLNLPATFFVCPGLVNQRRWLWNHEARERLRRLEPAALAALAKQCGAPAALEPFVEWMKTLDIAARGRIEQEVQRLTRGFVPSPLQREAWDLAGWEELRSLDPALVTIGSHSMTHPILPSLPASSLEFEVRESRRQLEARLGRPVEVFSYPNGDQGAAAVECVREHYRVAVTTAPGRAERGADPLLLPRWSAPNSVLKLARVLFPWPSSGGWLAVSAPTRRATTLLAASLRTLAWMMTKGRATTSS